MRFFWGLQKAVQKAVFMAKKEYVTGAELARRLGVKRQRIQRLFNQGKIKRRRDKKYNFEECKVIIESGRILDPNHGINATDNPPPQKNTKKKTAPGEFETLLEARTAYEGARARIAELDLRKRRGELLEKKEVTAAAQKILTVIKTKILAVPSKIAPEIAGNDSAKEVREIIKTALTEALEELAALKKLDEG